MTQTIPSPSLMHAKVLECDDDNPKTRKCVFDHTKLDSGFITFYLCEKCRFGLKCFANPIREEMLGGVK